jgi:hypothetical protein
MVIYKVTNKISGKIYVGKDMNNDEQYFGSGVKIKDAIKKYGKDNFRKDIICQCYDYSILNELESFFIYLLSATNPDIGYNMTFGGDGGPITLNHPDKFDIYERIKKANSGMNHFTKRLNKEEYEKYIENKRNKTSGQNHYSKKLNKEEYEKFRERMKRQTSGQNSPRSKKIKVISPDNKEYFYYGDFKQKIYELNNGSSGLYCYLINLLHNKKISINSKYTGWKAEYIKE